MLVPASGQWCEPSSFRLLIVINRRLCAALVLGSEAMNVFTLDLALLARVPRIPVALLIGAILRPSGTLLDILQSELLLLASVLLARLAELKGAVGVVIARRWPSALFLLALFAQNSFSLFDGSFDRSLD
ncbi:MAG: hypothetical protein KKH54_01745, partial [Alphaproteobacteria bacterium]|nr:hypothetical protein [Alphaproteobacteria bacterium]